MIVDSCGMYVPQDQRKTIEVQQVLLEWEILGQHVPYQVWFLHTFSYDANITRYQYPLIQYLPIRHCYYPLLYSTRPIIDRPINISDLLFRIEHTRLGWIIWPDKSINLRILCNGRAILDIFVPSTTDQARVFDRYFRTQHRRTYYYGPIPAFSISYHRSCHSLPTRPDRPINISDRIVSTAAGWGGTSTTPRQKLSSHRLFNSFTHPTGARGIIITYYYIVDRFMHGFNFRG